MTEYIQLSIFEPIEIPLTQGYTATIDRIDSDLLRFKWFYRSDYAARRTRTGHLLMHRVILERKIGRALLSNEQCDHIDRNRFNNRRDNLRIATHGQNMMNKKSYKSSKTGYKGVIAPEGRHYKYRARITYQDKHIWLGSFDTAEQAHAAYCEKAKELFGEFANCD